MNTSSKIMLKVAAVIFSSATSVGHAQGLAGVTGGVTGGGVTGSGYIRPARPDQAPLSLLKKNFRIIEDACRFSNCKSPVFQYSARANFLANRLLYLHDGSRLAIAKAEVLSIASNGVVKVRFTKLYQSENCSTNLKGDERDKKFAEIFNRVLNAQSITIAESNYIGGHESIRLGDSNIYLESIDLNLVAPVTGN